MQENYVFDSDFIIELGPAIFACNTRIMTINLDEITTLAFILLMKIRNTYRHLLKEEKKNKNDSGILWQLPFKFSDFRDLFIRT